jgi:hypothetical protein
VSLAGGGPARADGSIPYTGDVTDALLVPTHRLAVDHRTHRAAGDLVFVARDAAHVRVRACLARRDVRWHVCFTTTTAEAAAVNVTPLQFRRGRYVVRWSVAGVVVARWRFTVA